MGFPGGTGGKEPACQCRRHKRPRFHPWVGKIPWRRSWQPTPVFFPGESPWTEKPGGLQSIGSQESGMTEPAMHAWTCRRNSWKFLEAEWSLFLIIKKLATEQGFCAQESYRVSPVQYQCDGLNKICLGEVLTLLPKSWLSMHQCQTEIWRQSYGGRRKSDFIILPGKRETQ